MTHPCRGERYIISNTLDGYLWKCNGCGRIWHEPKAAA